MRLLILKSAEKRSGRRLEVLSTVLGLFDIRLSLRIGNVLNTSVQSKSFLSTIKGDLGMHAGFYKDF